MKQNESVIKLNKTVKENEKEIENLQTQIEIMQEKLGENFVTKKADGSFNDSVRLCIIE